MDFSKTYDLFNYIFSIGKLPALVPWICSFLDNRRQCVRYNQTLSDYATLLVWHIVCVAENVSVKMTAKGKLILMTFWSGRKPTNKYLTLPSVKFFKCALRETLLRISTLKLGPNPYLLFLLPNFWYLVARGPQVGLSD